MAKMKAKKILATIVGVTQGGIGMTAVILACILYLDSFILDQSLGIQTTLKVSQELVPLYLLAFSVFGFFSIISSLFLVQESSEPRLEESFS